MQRIALELLVPVLGNSTVLLEPTSFPGSSLSLSRHWGRVGEDSGNEVVLEHVNLNNITNSNTSSA